MRTRQARQAMARIGEAMQWQADAFAAGALASLPAPHAVPSIIAGLTGNFTFASADFAKAQTRDNALQQIGEALRRERKKARANHAAYDFSRHVSLHQTRRYLLALAAGPSALQSMTDKSGTGFAQKLMRSKMTGA